MSLLDAITGGAYERAAKANQFAIQSGLNLGADALNSGTAAAQGYLGVNTTGAGQNSLTALQDSYGTARNDLMNGSNQALGYLGKLGEQYSHMVQGGQGAYDRFLDATGANGAAGSQAAQAAFQSSPGYQFSLDQALGAVQRSAAARGGLAGGNLTQDIMRTATGLADQNYQQYINNLGTAAQSYGTGLAGQGQGLTAQANAAQGLGTQLASLGQTFGRDQAGIYGTAAQQQVGFGQGLAGLQGNAANALVQNNNTLAQGQTQSSNNFLGALLGGASSVFGAAGKAGGFGNLFK